MTYDQLILEFYRDNEPTSGLDTLFVIHTENNRNQSLQSYERRWQSYLQTLVGMKKVRIGYIDTVHGQCPHCAEDTLLVAIVTDIYKCTMCGQETKQYINGSIKYLKLDETDREWIKKQTNNDG